MNRIGRFTLLVAFVFSTLTAFCQEDLSIGNWRTHLPYQKVNAVEVFGKKVYAATDYELFYYDTEDNSINILNKINGLSDIGISTISYCKGMNLLLVAYSNANVDLIDTEGKITNMSDIKDKAIIGNKRINNVTFDNELAYLACGFGIVVFDLSRREVKDTYYIGDLGTAVNVTDIAFYNDRIYASSDDGMYYAQKNSQNLATYEAWTFDESLIHPHLNYNEIEVFNNRLYINSAGGYNKDTLYVYNGSTWDYFDKENTSQKRELRAYNDRFIITNNYHVSVLNNNLETICQINWPGGAIEPLSAAMDNNGCYWVGDKRRGMIKTTTGSDNEDILPNGPSSKNVFEVKSCGENVWIATGGHDANWAPRWMRDGVAHFDGQWWTSINAWNTQGFDTINDFVCTATNPSDPSITYVGTWGHGLLKLKDNKLETVYQTNNSSLGVWSGNPPYVCIAGLAFDSHNNLWVANSAANNLLSVLKTDGTWQSFNLGGSNSAIDLTTMIIDHNDYKWVMRRRGNDVKILVFNDNGTLDNTSDDRVVELKCVERQGGMPGGAVYSMAVDNDGAVWVGTDSGPCVFSDTKRIFNSTEYDASLILIPRNDGTTQADPLFSGAKVLSIAVDGANNKWFGLETGVYQMSSNGKTQLNHFNTDNSPLLNNSVNTMAINSNGDVFFGTDDGVISYRGKATPPVPQPNTNVVVYPNPVRPEYNGYVGIKGIATNALVRITTVDGAFVTEIRADGSQAVWDCHTIDGKKVAPGIYMIYLSTDDGEEKFATKVLVMG